MSALTARLHRLEKIAPRPAEKPPLAGRYAADPCGYARAVLGVRWWAKQEEIARLLLTPPHKVLVKASHGVGKSYLAAGLINWFFDSFYPSACLTTAPTATHVKDVLWREVRLQRGYRGGFSGPAAPELRTSVEHYAKGITTAKGEAFQGRHQRYMMFGLDEAVGVDPVYWQIIKSMFQGDGNHFWWCIFNPTDTSSQAYQEEAQGDGWHVVEMSAIEHPNVLAALRGEPAPYPGAVSLGQLGDWVRDWCTPLGAEDRLLATDLEWPPGSGSWVRPGPLFESRALGRWPSSGTYGVWSDHAFSLAESLVLELPPPEVLPEIGCDVARFGDDFTAIHTRWGRVSVAHERHNGWDLERTTGRLKRLCRELADKVNARLDPAQTRVRPEQIPVKVDVDGIGAGVMDHRGGFRFIGVSAASTARNEVDYPNKRSEMWFNTRQLVDGDGLSFARLDPATRRLLRRQFLAPEWRVDGAGRCLVEPKERTKERLGASPDDADAVNLAWYVAGVFKAPAPVANPAPRPLGPRRGRERTSERRRR